MVTDKCVFKKLEKDFIKKVYLTHRLRCPSFKSYKVSIFSKKIGGRSLMMLKTMTEVLACMRVTKIKRRHIMKFTKCQTPSTFFRATEYLFHIPCW